LGLGPVSLRALGRPRRDWGWAPGPVVAPAVYAPALVGFVGPVGVSVNVGIPVPPFGWVALGFGEPVLPWWGPVGFIGRPFWGGWYGPRIVNNVVINNTRIVNATAINRFQNMNVHNAVVGVPRDQFGRGRVRLARLGPNDLQKLQPVHGQLGIKPDRGESRSQLGSRVATARGD